MKLKQESAMRSRPDLPDFGSMESNYSLSASELLKNAIDSKIKSVRPATSINEVTPATGENLVDLGKALEKHFDLSNVKMNFGFRDTSSYSVKTQRWQGHILEIEGDKIIAQLTDLTNPEGTYEMFEFPKSDISPEDISLLSIGAIFYLSLGSIMENGQLKKESMLRFKRSALWSEKEFDEAADLAERLKRNSPKI